MLARSSASRRASDKVERGSTAWRSTHMVSASATSGSHGSPSENPAPGPASDGGRHGIGARSGSRPSTSTTRSGRDLGVRQPQLLALVDERRAAQRVQHQERSARARARPCPPSSKRLARRGRSWFSRNHAGHAVPVRERLEVVDRGAEGLRVPRQLARTRSCARGGAGRPTSGSSPRGGGPAARPRRRSSGPSTRRPPGGCPRRRGRGSTPSPRRGAAARPSGRAAAGPWRSSRSRRGGSRPRRGRARSAARRALRPRPPGCPS